MAPDGKGPGTCPALLDVFGARLHTDLLARTLSDDQRKELERDFNVWVL